MKINAITKTQPTYKQITFTGNTPNDAALSVHNVPQFQKNLQRTIMADAVQNNPFEALVYKISKMVKYFVKPRFEENSFRYDA